MPICRKYPACQKPATTYCNWTGHRLCDEHAAEHKNHAKFHQTLAKSPQAEPSPHFHESKIGGAFDGYTVTSDADPGL